jgi:hypothetical protein
MFYLKYPLDIVICTLGSSKMGLFEGVALTSALAKGGLYILWKLSQKGYIPFTLV